MKKFISKVPLSWCTMKGAITVALVFSGIGFLSNCREIGGNWVTCLIGILVLCILANLEFVTAKLLNEFWIGSAFFGLFCVASVTLALGVMAYLQASKTFEDMRLDTIVHIASNRVTLESLCVIVVWSWISLLRRYHHVFHQRRNSVPKNPGFA